MSEPVIPPARLDYEAFLVELKKNGGNISKTTRALGMSRESIYWRQRNDPEFRAKLQQAKDEMSLEASAEAVLEPPPDLTLGEPADLAPKELVPVLSEDMEKPVWQRQFERSLKTYGLPMVAATHAGVEYGKIEALLLQNSEFQNRCRILQEEANGQILLFARQRAMSGKADQLLLSWLRAYNECFREKASIQVQATTKNAHVHLLLNKETLERLGSRWAEMSGGKSEAS